MATWMTSKRITRRVGSLLSVGLLLLAGAAAAEPLAVGDRIEPFTLEDQHGDAHSLDTDVKVLLFSRDMDGGDLLKDALAEVGPDFLTEKHAVYLSDISGMPGLVARMFAIPSMRNRAYPMWLDRDGQTTARLPDEEGKATLVFCHDLEITRIEHHPTASEIRNALGIAD